ncbi:multicopper oxidase family protein [Chitinilyticum litopenaei]|uniref:multicopper oxidase family protein n=1 Tax=Chitinilyticum litopenaei TaxID=1121276 RepID=UPI000415EDA6|nr:copper oxidase [Chitinilyticum litopenaei]
MQRRDFLGVSAGALASLGLAGIATQANASKGSGDTPVAVKGGRTPVTTLNTRTLGFRMNNGVKEYHLIAEAIEQEVAPGMTALFWGYNGSSPGPTIEAIEGDRVRIFVSNKLPEHTTIHWHGILLPAGMDGVGGLTQPQIKPGETYVYEFTLGKSGTFMYHPHADEMVQMAQGMMGMFIVHPKNPAERRVDRDYAFMLASYKIDPGTRRPDPAEMLDFNLWTFNSRTFPAIAPLVARTGERVRIRVANLTMTNHPVHVHGVDFRVTGTDGGWIPEAGQWPEVTTDVAVGQIRVIEFVAKAPGDWALHCHKSHHTMGPMGHGVPNMLGVDQAAATQQIEALLPGQHYMEMGTNGMAEMQDMAAMAAMMPLPPNTLPMMTGEGPFGPIEMGGMFTLLKVRDELQPGDYSDPGWYEHPPGTVARPADSKAFSGIPI